MKKIILLFVFTLLIYSCASKANYVKGVMSKVYIGMTISEFNKVVTNKELLSMKANTLIYKVGGYNWYDHDNADGSGDHRFLYFTNNKLTQVDKGERATDLRIKIDK